MDQENKSTTGAPSNDTTSALFVSARKKQLEQQEADRRAKEKEEQRLAAEAEVRRLEREVEERRRKTEEDAKLAEEEAKRVAAESRAKMAQASENPDAVLGARSANKGARLPQMPKVPAAAASADGEAVAKAPPNGKLLALIGGGVLLAAAVVIVLVTVLGGGNDGGEMSQGGMGENAGGESYEGVYYGEYLTFEYPEGWYVAGLGDTETLAGRVAVSPSEEFTESDIGSLPFVVIADYSAAFETSEAATMDDLLTEFTDDMVNALSLTDYLGEPTNVQYQEAEELPDGSGMGYSVVIAFGDVSCFSQITMTNEGRVHGSLAMGLADEDTDPINVVLMSIEPTEG